MKKRSKALPINLNNWPKVTRECLSKVKMTPDDVNWFFFTQVNLRTIEGVMKSLGAPMNKTHFIMDKWGYTGSACIPLVLYDVIDKGLLPPPGKGNGEVIAFCTSGGGANFSAAVLRWW